MAYSVQKEILDLLKNGILSHPKHEDLRNRFDQTAVDAIKFTGSPEPNIPINWRFAESVSALKGVEALLLRDYLDKRFGVVPGEIEINTDIHHMASSKYRQAVWGIYRTKDERFVHIHGSMNPDPTLKALGLPLDMPDTPDPANPIRDRIAESTATELDTLLNTTFHQPATICRTVSEYNSTPHALANQHRGL
ncbi:hypothetical protein PRZ48_005875 [Zasmidium cellare]|uniref:Uncharacterized protein n=1 Tax=Zasmidium cellare TaxID=395010 RepID=A0ABR0EMH2_ZASCE|nr:hypothetical protein PRZ48_005875 [Zasmidium cellare]